MVLQVAGRDLKSLTAPTGSWPGLGIASTMEDAGRRIILPTPAAPPLLCIWCVKLRYMYMGIMRER